MKKSKVMIVGDIHGHWGYLNTLINKYHPDIILQVGDFGYWPRFHNTDVICENPLKKHQDPWNFYGVKCQNTKVYFCPGNHEDHWELKKYNNKVTNIYDKVYYMPRGSSLTLPDGREVLFIGGADSIDKYRRTIGYDWFPEEIISNRDIYGLPDMKIDIVISHTCPQSFIPEINTKLGPDYINSGKYFDPSIVALDRVLEQYKPSLWYFGHFHDSADGKFQDTKWFMLDQERETNCWRWLI